MKIAIVGSGPAGFYAAGQLLNGADVSIDMIDRLPTPWGLVRAGVAPDHPKIKTVTRVFEKIAANPRFRFFGGVEFGRDVTRSELAERYHAIVYATGTSADRPLGIPGEELSRPATAFVGWYNGHPDFADEQFDLTHERAVVIGNGNVALDVARMLVLPEEDLRVTDTADHAIEAFARSSVQEVVVVGRRGAEQAAFTNPELRELGDVCDVVVDPDELSGEGRNVDVLREYAARPADRAAADRPAVPALAGRAHGGHGEAGPQRARRRSRGAHGLVRDDRGRPRPARDRLSGRGRSRTCRSTRHAGRSPTRAAAWRSASTPSAGSSAVRRA